MGFLFRVPGETHCTTAWARVRADFKPDSMQPLLQTPAMENMVAHGLNDGTGVGVPIIETDSLGVFPNLVSGCPAFTSLEKYEYTTKLSQG